MQKTSIQLVTLGQLCFQNAGKQVGGHLSVRELALAAYLAWHMGQDIPRLTLLRLLWPQSEQRPARHRLSQVIWRLKKAHSFLQLHTTPSSVRVQAGSFTLDASLLLDAVASREWKTIFALYRGPFIPGATTLRGTPLLDWVSDTDCQIKAAVVAAFDVAVETAADRGEWRQVLRMAKVVRPFHPRRHSLDKLCIAATAASGQTRQAAKLTVGLRGSLAKPKTASGSSLAVIAKRFRSSDGPASVGSFHKLPFVGRQAQFESLSNQYHDCTRGAVRCGLIQGERGIGKTRLAEHLLRYVAIKGGRVLTSIGRRGMQTVPFGLVSDLLRSASDTSIVASMPSRLQAAIGRIVPEVGGSKDNRETTHVGEVLEAVGLFLERYRRGKPLVILFDRLEYADEKSLLQIHYLIARLKEQPILILACHRTDVDQQDDIARTIEHMSDNVGAVAIRLKPFRYADAYDLFDAFEESQSVNLAAETRDELFRLSQGQPFFLTELLRGFATTGYIANDVRVNLPSSIASAITERIGMLPKPLRRILDVLALIDQPSDLGVVSTILSVSLDTVIEATADLHRRGLLVRDGMAVRLSHDFVAPLITGRMTEHERKELHADVASCLAATRGLPDALVGLHFERAGNAANAAVYYGRAAEYALDAEAYSAAEQYARYALECGSDARRRVRDTSILARVFWSTRRYSDAREIILRQTEEDAAICLGECCIDKPTLTLLADITEGRRTIQQCLDGAMSVVGSVNAASLNVGHAELIRVVASIASNSAGGSYWNGFVGRFKGMAVACEDDMVAALILSSCACVEAAFIGVREADQTVKSAVRRSACSGRQFAEVRARAALGTVALLGARLTEAGHALRSARNIAQSIGLFEAASAAGNNLAVVLMEVGQWQAASDLLVANLHRLSATDALIRKCNLTVLSAESGRSDVAAKHAKSAVEEATVLGIPWAAAVGHSVLGDYAIKVGDMPAAQYRYDSVVDILDRGHLGGTDSSYAVGYAAEWEALSGNLSSARERVDVCIDELAGKHVLAAMRMRIVGARLVGVRSRSDSMRTLMDLHDEATSLGATCVALRAEQAMRSLF